MRPPVGQRITAELYLVSTGTKIGTRHLQKDIYVLVECEEETYVASTIGAEIYMSGESASEALRNLLLFMEDVSDEYLAGTGRSLGPMLERRREFLSDVLTK